MPIYDYHCNKCEKDLKDHFKKMNDPGPSCCGQIMQQLYQTKIEVFDTTQVFEHVADKPMQFGSKRALRQYCRSNGMTSHQAE